MTPIWEIYAARYASVQRSVHGNFQNASDWADDPMPLDFFIWVAIDRQAKRTVVIDTGFNLRSGGRRNRVQECSPAVILNALDVDVVDVADVIITHLHYDHAGNFADFPSAVFHLQPAEIAYATGPCMNHGHAGQFYEPDDLTAAVQALYGSRLHFCEANDELAPGLSVHLIGGHTAGLQVVRINTARGIVVLASDAAHFYANKALRNPFPAIHDLDAMISGYDRLDALATSPDHVIPGHDPEVLRIYPRFANAAGIDIASVHLPPLDQPRIDFGLIKVG
jgi:glyoxylase-like metal-dependent hydrolase (beta-lactamase superfamily II)